MDTFPNPRRTYQISDLTDTEEILLYSTPGWDSYFFCESLGKETNHRCESCYYCSAQGIVFKYRKPR